MRILSQDGMADLPYESIGICINYHNKTDIIAYPAGTYSPDDEYWTLAKYSTEAKARKAMEMLHEAYTGIPLILQNVDISDDVTKMFEKWKKQGICVVSENQPSKVEYVGNVLFQFPADDEVEVSK